MSAARILRLAAVAALVFTVAATPLRAAEESAGTRAAAFLAPGAPVSVLGMGGATLALGRDVAGAAWNPAALGWVGTPQLAFAHATLAEQTNQEWLGAGGRLGGGRTRWGVSVLALDEGTITGMNAQGDPTGDVRAQDLAFTLQLARPLGAHAAAGGGARYVRQSIGDVAGNGLAFDAGAQLRAGPLAFAVAGRNFGGGMRWADGRWRMPASLGAGVALEGGRVPLRLALDWEAPADYYRNVRVGGEWRLRDRFALRGGWRAELGADAEDRLGGPAFGFGAGAGVWWLDYGYTVAAGSGGTHRVGLVLRGRERPAATTPDARPFGPDPAPESRRRK